MTAMSIAKKIVGVAVGMIGLGVLLHFTLSPFYETDENMEMIGQMWTIANHFMLVGLFVALAFVGNLRKSTEELEEGAPAKIRAMLLYYATLALVVLFLWNYVDDIVNEEQSQTRKNWWPFINAAFIVLMGYVSERLVRSR